MASTGVKEYTLKINGITQGVKDTTSLAAAVNALDNAVKNYNTEAAKSTATGKQKANALTEEEKAAKKLADTQKRIEQANSAANRAQIAANRELRERTREVTRSVAAESLAEDSIAAMGMRLTDLRNEYEQLTAAQRADQEEGGKLLEQIQELDAEYKALRESTGNFRDSVGHYEKALSGLNELKDRFELVTRGSTEAAAAVTGSNDALDGLADSTELVAKGSEQLAGVVALATTAQEVYNAVIKENVIQEKAAAVMTAVRTLQTKAAAQAEALATKNTLLATIAQKAFNIVANANPYVLLATALITVVGALLLFASRTEDAAEDQKTFNELQAVYLDQLDAEAAKLKDVGDARVKALENQVELLTASGAKTKEIRAAEDELNKGRIQNNARQRGFYAEEIANLDENRKKVEQLTEVLNKLKIAQASGESKLKIDIDLDGNVEKVKVEDALDSVQGAIDNLNRSVKVAVDLQADEEQIKQDIAVQKATRLKADKDLAKERLDKAREQAELNLNITRAAEDARIAIIEDSYKRETRTINTQFDRQIEDLKKTLATEKKLTEAGRKAINDNIAALNVQRNQALAKLDKERQERELQDLRASEDARLELTKGAEDRERAQIQIAAQRQVDDLKKRLQTEKDLTETQQVAIQTQIYAIQQKAGNDLAALTAKQATDRANQELTALDFVLQQANDKIGQITKRNKTGLKLIDVDGTKQNAKDANAALDTYIGSLRDYELNLRDAHEKTLSTLQAGTPEYVAEVQKYAAATEAVTERIKKAHKEQEDNTKESNKVVLEYYKELFTGITKWAQAGADLVGNLFSTLNMGLQASIDTLNDSLEDINDKYEEAQKTREDAVKSVEDTEAKLQDATGGTAEALKEQLADEMRARNEAARQEQQLQREKEKKEAEIAKKQKQMRRNDLIAGIATGIANTAQGATAALQLGFPFGIIAAGLMLAFGGIQVGIMAKQLTKLADGGPIVGPSHAEGGVNVGMGYEVEGGEFVTNKRQYAANRPLVEFINASDGTITASDLAGVLPGETGAPLIIGDTVQSSEDRIVDAIAGIDIRPVVAVTDIMDVQAQITTVQDLSGFSSRID